MNKKKAIIESFAAQENQEPSAKIVRKEHNFPDHLDDRPNGSISSSSGGAGSGTGGVTTCATVGTKSEVSAGAADARSRSRSTSGGSLDQELSVPVVGSSDNSRISYLNSNIFTESVQNSLKYSYKASKDYFDDTSGIKLSCQPFRHCILPNFISKSEYVEDLESALLDLPLRDKNNDLYKFSQSRDLNHSKSSTISTFRALCDVVHNFLSDVTDIPLNTKIDLFCSQYKYSDVLLCHDDELEERRIAFIYYLVPELWSATDGGTLDLFDTDGHDQPKSIVKSVVPKRNSFLFFEVSAKSFHQVSEILSEDKTRLSISGWFHGNPLSRPPPFIDAVPPALPYGSIEEEVFYSWFNPLYLAPDVQSDIRKRFEEDSEIELTDFLREEKYNSLVAALRDESISWKLLGPANKKNYYTADTGTLPEVVTQYLRVVQSDALFLVLANLTGLKLHALAPLSTDEAKSHNGASEQATDNDVCNPCCRSEIRKWEHGCYTLAHDTDADVFDFALDSMLYIECDKEWLFENGGYTSYIAKGEEEELLSVGPSGNSLALVYRDKDTMRFVKHLNHRVTKMSPPRFFEINAVYYE